MECHRPKRPAIRSRCKGIEQIPNPGRVRDCPRKRGRPRPAARALPGPPPADSVPGRMTLGSRCLSLRISRASRARTRLRRPALGQQHGRHQSPAGRPGRDRLRRGETVAHARAADVRPFRAARFSQDKHGQSAMPRLRAVRRWSKPWIRHRSRWPRQTGQGLAVGGPGNRHTPRLRNGVGHFAACRVRRPGEIDFRLRRRPPAPRHGALLGQGIGQRVPGPGHGLGSGPSDPVLVSSSNRRWIASASVHSPQAVATGRQVVRDGQHLGVFVPQLPVIRIERPFEVDGREFIVSVIHGEDTQAVVDSRHGQRIDIGRELGDGHGLVQKLHGLGRIGKDQGTARSWAAMPVSRWRGPSNSAMTQLGGPQEGFGRRHRLPSEDEDGQGVTQCSVPPADLPPAPGVKARALS